MTAVLRARVRRSCSVALAPRSAAGADRRGRPKRRRGRWPAREVKFPPYEIRTLPNGLQVVAVLHHEQPVVSMRMIVRAGSALDPRGQGWAWPTWRRRCSIRARRRSRRSEMNDAIDFIGGAMGAGAGTDLTFVNVVVMKDSFEAGLRMLSDMARQPGVRAGGDRAPAAADAVRACRSASRIPEFVADAVFDRLVYGFHPYGMPQTGTPETLAAITRDDLVAFHQQQLRARTTRSSRSSAT